MQSYVFTEEAKAKCAQEKDRYSTQAAIPVLFYYFDSGLRVAGFSFSFHLFVCSTNNSLNIRCACNQYFFFWFCRIHLVLIASRW